MPRPAQPKPYSTPTPTYGSSSYGYGGTRADQRAGSNSYGSSAGNHRGGGVGGPLADTGGRRTGGGTPPPSHRDQNQPVILPIEAISPYSSKWTIKARITSKSTMRSWSNAKGQGVLFSVNLLDASKKEIKGTSLLLHAGLPLPTYYSYLLI